MSAPESNQQSAEISQTPQSKKEISFVNETNKRLKQAKMAFNVGNIKGVFRAIKGDEVYNLNFGGGNLPNPDRITLSGDPQIARDQLNRYNANKEYLAQHPEMTVDPNPPPQPDIQPSKYNAGKLPVTPEQQRAIDKIFHPDK